MKNKLLIAALVMWLGLLFTGLKAYPGSVFVYLLFSFVYLVILVSGFFRLESYGYMFLSVMLWLGFWLKFVLHLISGTSYIEPVGTFTATPSNLDAVLLISSAAGAGMFLAWLFCTLCRDISSLSINGGKVCVPRWYKKHRISIWVVVWLGIAGWPLINIGFGINQIGLVPRTILFWPMNAVVSWFVTVGLSVSIMTLIFWDIKVHPCFWNSIFAVVMEASLSTISLVSRGTFILHAIPPIVAVCKSTGNYINRISRVRLFIGSCSFLFAFIFSMSMVTSLRTHLYSGGPRPEKLVDWINGGADFISQVQILAVDRWIGIEGLMSVQSNPSKGNAMFKEALFEKREIGKVTMYQKVCNSHYQWMDVTKWQFGAVPGAVAFLYYSGSCLVVASGLFLMTLAVLVSEYIIGYFIGNPFLCSFWGMAVANMVAQFGIAPRQVFVNLYMLSCALFIIWVLQNRSAAMQNDPASDQVSGFVRNI